MLWTPKKICPNIKSIFFEINLFASFTKTSCEIFHVFPVDKPLNSKCGKRIFNFSVNKTTKCFQRHIQNPAKHLRRLKYILKQVYMGNLKFLWFNLIYSEIKIIQRELHKKLCSETNFVHLNALSVYVPSSLLLTRVTGNKKR